MGNTQAQNIKISGIPIDSFYDSRRKVIIAVTKSTVQYYHASTKALLKTVNISSFRKVGVCSSCYFEDEDILVTGDDDYRVRVYHASSGDFICTLSNEDSTRVNGPPKPGTHDFVRCVCALPYDRLLSAGSDGVMRMWKRKTGEILGFFLHTANDEKTAQNNESSSSQQAIPISAVTFDLSRNYLFSGATDGVIRAYSIDSIGPNSRRTYPICEMRGHKGVILSLVVATVPDLLVSSGVDGSIRLWDMKTPGKEVGSGRYFAQSMQYDKLRDILFCGSGDGQLAAFQVLNAGLQTGEIRRIRTIEMHKSAILSLYYSTLSDSLVSTSTDNSVGLYPSITQIPYEQALASASLSVVSSNNSNLDSVLENDSVKVFDNQSVGNASEIGYLESGEESNVARSETDSVSVFIEKEESNPNLSEETITKLIEELKIAHTNSSMDNPASSVIEVPNPLESEEKLVNLSTQLFDVSESGSRDRRDKLVNWFKQMKDGLETALKSAENELDEFRKIIWRDRWAVIDPNLGKERLEENIQQRFEQMRERHKREEKEMEELAEKERGMYEEQLPVERARVAAIYKTSFDRYKQQVQETRTHTANTVRGVLASSFRVLLNRYQIGALMTPTSTSVYRGLDLQNQQLIAIKAFPEVVGNSLNTTLTHPSLVRVIDQRTDFGAGSIYVIMEMMKKDLLTYVKEKGRLEKDENSGNLPIPMIQSITKMILNCLVYLHSQSLVVRDLKPSTVLVNPIQREDGSEYLEVKLTHFGIMRSLLGTPESEPPEEGNLYSAPEIFGRVINISSDIWSLACVIIYLFQTKLERGAPLFYGGDTLDIMKTMVNVVGKPPLEKLLEMANELHMAEDGIALVEHVGKLEETFNCDPEKTKEKIKSVCHNASEQALDLLSKMLVFDSRDRITAEKALQHHFFADPS